MSFGKRCSLLEPKFLFKKTNQNKQYKNHSRAFKNNFLIKAGAFSLLIGKLMKLDSQNNMKFPNHVIKGAHEINPTKKKLKYV